MNRYRLVHVTEFRYDGPVSESYNTVRLRPRDDEFQSCLSFKLQSEPASRTSSYVDHWGNWVHGFNVLGEHRALLIETQSLVLVYLPPDIPTESIILKAVEKDRRLRYQHASEMRADLQRAKRDSESRPVTGEARPPAATSMRRTSWFAKTTVFPSPCAWGKSRR